MKSHSLSQGLKNFKKEFIPLIKVHTKKDIVENIKIKNDESSFHYHIHLSSLFIIDIKKVIQNAILYIVNVSTSELYMHWHNIVVKTLSLKTSITTSGNEKQSMQ